MEDIVLRIGREKVTVESACVTSVNGADIQRDIVSAAKYSDLLSQRSKRHAIRVKLRLHLDKDSWKNPVKRAVFSALGMSLKWMRNPELFFVEGGLPVFSRLLPSGVSEVTPDRVHKIKELLDGDSGRHKFILSE
jgi:hypothetical protein